MAMQPKKYRKADKAEAKRNAPKARESNIGNPETRYKRTMKAHKARQTFDNEAVAGAAIDMVMDSTNMQLLKGTAKAGMTIAKSLGAPQRKLLSKMKQRKPVQPKVKKTDTMKKAKGKKVKKTGSMKKAK
jgi:hypothetical protein